MGLASDGAWHLLACDSRHSVVFRLHLATRRLDRFTPPGIALPNHPAVDRARGCFSVSDSIGHGRPGPGVWRYDLRTGQGALWCGQAMRFANSLALVVGALLVVETEARCITRIAINADGSAGPVSTLADDLPGWPDGLALDEAGRVYVSCCEPSRILIEDPFAHMLCHPTNIAFRGSTLFSANLGRWHVTAIVGYAAGPALPL